MRHTVGRRQRRVLPVVCALLAATSAGLAVDTGTAAAATVNTTCYDGTYTVPPGIDYLTIQAIGQAGQAGPDFSGNALQPDHGGGAGGLGARIAARNIPVQPGEVFYYGVASPTVLGGMSGRHVIGDVGSGGAASFVSTSAPVGAIAFPSSGRSCAVPASDFVVVAGGGGGGGGGSINGPGGTGGQAGSGGNPGGTNGANAGGGGGPGTETSGGAGGSQGSVEAASILSGGSDPSPFDLNQGAPGEVGAAATAGAVLQRSNPSSPQYSGFGTGGLGGNGHDSFVGHSVGGGGGWYGGGGGAGDGGAGGVRVLGYNLSADGGDGGDGGGGGGGGASHVAPGYPYVDGGVTTAAPAVSFIPVLSGTLALSARPSPATTGKPVRLTAAYSNPAATGTVTFTDSGQTLGTAPLVKGIATLVHTFSVNPETDAVTRHIEASYPGDNGDIGTDPNGNNLPELDLDVDTPPSVPDEGDPQPVSKTYGTAAVFAVQRAGFPIPTIQWQISRDNGADYANLSGETANTLSFLGQVSDTGDLFRAVLTNSAGTATSAAAAVTITPAPLTVTGSTTASTYGSAPPAVTPVYTGLIYPDTAYSLAGPSPISPATCTSTAAASSPVGHYPVTCSGAANPNYTISYVPGTVTVGPVALTVTASDISSVYGSAPAAPTPSYTGFVNGDTASALSKAPTCSTTARAGSPVGTYPTTCSGAAGGGYTVGYAAGTAQVEPAPLTVSAPSASGVFGAAPRALTPSFSGLVNGDSAAALTTAPSCSTTATSTSPVGTYPITCSGAVDGNYTVSYVAGTYTVTPAPLTVTAPSVSSTYGSAVPALRPTYSGLVGTTPPATPPTCSTTATPSSPAGSYPITCGGGADDDYAFSYLAGTLTVQRSPLIFTATPATRVFGAPNPAFGYTVTGLVNGDNAAVVSGRPSLTTTATASSDPGSYPITVGIGTLASANYSFVPDAGALVVTAAPVTVTAAPISYVQSVLAKRATFTVAVRNTATGAPAVGEPVTVSGTTLTNKRFGCTATTNALGVATCTSTDVTALVIARPRTFTATVAAARDYAAGAGTGPITVP